MDKELNINLDELDKVNPPNQDMTPEEAKAALGIATRLSEDMLTFNNPPVGPETAQGGTEMGGMGGMSEDGSQTPQKQNKRSGNELKELVRSVVKEEVGSALKDLKDELKSEISEEMSVSDVPRENSIDAEEYEE